MLCIVQDERDDIKAQELSKMGDIYQNACLTIIAADGCHADYGLRGIQEISQPLKRSCKQYIFSLGEHGKAAFRSPLRGTSAKRAALLTRSPSTTEGLGLSKNTSSQEDASYSKREASSGNAAAPHGSRTSTAQMR
jgi:Heterokaryon incompatibility protein (HET)